MEPEDVIREIEAAFDGITKPITSLRQFKLTDEKGMKGEITDKEWKNAGLMRQDTKWQEIPDSEIEECDCLLAHMQPDEFIYYLPAYMRFSVTHYKLPIWKSGVLGSTVFSLYPSSKNKEGYIYQEKQLSLLNEKQKQTIIYFLEFVANYANDVERPDAKLALERY